MIRQGDVFCVATDGVLARAINAVQTFSSRDRESTFNHAGVICCEDGVTLEAWWTVRQRMLYEAYAGCRVLIARPRSDVHVKTLAISMLEDAHLGQKYPFWRLALHLFPPLARDLSAGGRYVVCSELVAKYLHYLGVRHEYFTGTNPDNLADEWRKWRDFKVVFDGRLSGAIK